MIDKIAESGQEIELELLIKAVCARPTMYVRTGDFSNVASFIDGFAYASESNQQEIRAFNKWLASLLNFPRNQAWWLGLTKIYPNSEDSIKELPKLFSKFKESQQPKL